MAFRAPADLRAWIEHEATLNHCEPGAIIRRILQRARADGHGWPNDVRLWLLSQAANNDTPGDTDAAVIALVRHLAIRWPHGARLNR